MEDTRKEAYEEAVRLKGQSLSQWLLANLDAAAARNNEEVRTMRLAAEEFDRFCEGLDNPMPQSFRVLLEWEPEWADNTYEASATGREKNA